MKRLSFALSFVLLLSGHAVASTYEWTDEKGVVSFTDNPDQVPQRYRNSVKVRESIKGEVRKAPPVLEKQHKVEPSLPGPAVYGGHGEQWWKRRFAALRQEIDALQGSTGDQRERLTNLRRKITLYHRPSDREHYNALNAEIAANDSLLTERRSQLSELESEADREGVPLEWRK